MTTFEEDSQRIIHLKQHTFCLVLSSYAMYMYMVSIIFRITYIFPFILKALLIRRKDSVENIQISLLCDYKNSVNSPNMCIITKLQKSWWLKIFLIQIIYKFMYWENLDSFSSKLLSVMMFMNMKHNIIRYDILVYVKLTET